MTFANDWWSVDPPHVHDVVGFTVRERLIHALPAKSRVFQLDGRRMRNLEGLFGEFSRGLEFPDYFGNNWAALADCLDDLLWFDRVEAFVFVINDWNSTLTETSADRPILCGILEQVGSYWAELGYDGEDSVAFNTLLVD